MEETNGEDRRAKAAPTADGTLESPFNDARREAFAQGLAAGLAAPDAAAKAGYAPDRANVRKATRAPNLIGRVAAIRRQTAEAPPSTVQGLIARLTSLAEEAAKLASAAGMREARGMLVEAARLKMLLPEEPDDEGEDWAAAPYNREEWLAKYAPKP